MRFAIILLAVFLVAIAPLPLGSVSTPAWGPLAIGVATLAAALGTATALTRSNQPAFDLSRCWSFAVPLALVAAWSAVQATGILTDELAHPLWQATTAALGEPARAALTFDAFESGSALAKLLIPASIFWLALLVCRDAALTYLAFAGLALAGLGYAGYGLTAYFSGKELVLWFDKTSYLGTLTSTFVNRNSYATYAGLGLVVTTGLLLATIAAEGQRAGGLRIRVHGLLSALMGRGWLLILAWTTIASALLLTESRGGFLATIAGVTALLAAFALRRGGGLGFGIAAAAPILVAGIGMFAISGKQTDVRFAGAEDAAIERQHLYELSLEAIAERPLTGWGHGSFPDVFRLVRDDAVPQDVVMAHNSYLELALELGIPAAALLLLAVGALLLRCLIGARTRRRNAAYPCIGVGATVLVAAHALVDFSLQIPAVAATYALIMGAAVAQSWRSDG